MIQMNRILLLKIINSFLFSKPKYWLALICKYMNILQKSLYWNIITASNSIVSLPTGSPWHPGCGHHNCRHATRGRRNIHQRPPSEPRPDIAAWRLLAPPAGRSVLHHGQCRGSLQWNPPSGGQREGGDGPQVHAARGEHHHGFPYLPLPRNAR